MINDLIRVSDILDRNNLTKESDLLDSVIQKLSAEKVSPEEAMKHEQNTYLGTREGLDAEDNERYETELMANQIAKILIDGTGFTYENQDALEAELRELFENYSHQNTLKAIFDKIYPVINDESQPDDNAPEWDKDDVIPF